MKYLVFVTLLTLISSGSKGHVTLTGSIPHFSNKPISIFEYQDFFTGKRHEKLSHVIDRQGAFVLEYPTNKPVYIDIYLNGMFSGIYVQPGFTYHVKFNENGKLISITSEDKTNELLALFEARADAYYKANRGKGLYKNFPEYINKEKQAADSNSFFAQEILRYRIAALQFMLYSEKEDTVSLNRLESEVFVHNSINSSIPDYFRFLKSYAYERAKSLRLRRVSYDFTQHVKSHLKEVTFIKSDSVQQLAALAILRKAYRSEWSGPKERLDFLTDSIYQKASHPIVKQVAQNVKRDGNSLNPGNEIDDFQFVTSTGESYRLSSFKGKYVLVDFWFLACGPCRKNFPKLRKLTELNPNKLEIISLTPYDTKIEISAFLKKHPDYNWLFSAIDIKDDTIQYFNVLYFPTYILIDPDGKLVKLIGSNEMEKNFEAIAALIK